MLIRLLEAHRAAGSALAGRLLDEADLASRFWLVEPNAVEVVTVSAGVATTSDVAAQPDRNPIAPVSAPTAEGSVPTLDGAWGSVTHG